MNNFVGLYDKTKDNLALSIAKCQWGFLQYKTFSKHGKFLEHIKHVILEIQFENEEHEEMY